MRGRLGREEANEAHMKAVWEGSEGCERSFVAPVVLCRVEAGGGRCVSASVIAGMLREP